MSDRLPSRASQRRVIFVVDPVEIEQGGELMRELSSQPHVCVLSSQPDHSKADELVKRLERQSLLNPGHVLLVSPYDSDDYQLADEASDAFSLQKFEAFIRVCQLVGARKTSIKAAVDLKTKDRLEVSAEGKYVTAKGSVSADGTAIEQLVSRLSWSETFSGGEPDTKGALLHLEQKGLDRDITLRSLVDSRAHAGNPVKKRTMTVDLSQEGSRALNAAARLDLRVSSLSVDLKKVAERSHRFQVTYDVDF